MATQSKLLYTLKNGQQKWMTVKEYKNYINRLKSLKTIYDKYIEMGILDNSESKIYNIQYLVQLGSELMSEICNAADSITISGYNRIKNEINDKIQKSDFVEIVKYVSHKLNKDASGDDEKYTQKLLKQIEATVFNINFKNIFYQNFIESNDIKCTENSKNIIFPKLKSKDDKRFKEIVKYCAKVRKYIDDILWTQYREYAAVAEYISQGELSYDKYKQLVDFLHYQGNTDKRFKNQQKQYTVLIDNFLKAYKLCKTYGYNYFDDVENLILDMNKIKESA